MKKLSILFLLICLILIAFSTANANTSTTVSTNTSTTTGSNEFTSAFNPIKEYKSIEVSEKGINAYKNKVKEKNNKIKKEKLNNIMATITFDKPIPISKLEEYISTYKIKPVQVEIRCLEADGTRATISTRLSKGFKETDYIAHCQAVEANVDLIGYIGMFCLIDYSQIDNIQSDELTFLLDTSGDMYFEGRTEKDGKQRVKDIKANKRFPVILTWHLEDIGYIKHRNNVFFK